MKPETAPRHLLNWNDVPTGVWDACLDRAVAFGRGGGSGAAAGTGAGPRRNAVGAGREVVLLFFNDSLRTRVSMEMAARALGAGVSTVVPGHGTWGFAWGSGAMTGGEAEHIEEAVGVLSRYADVLGVRLFASGTDLEADRTDRRLRQIAAAASVPVVNLESASYHPCQALADAAVLRSLGFGGSAGGARLGGRGHLADVGTGEGNAAGSGAGERGKLVLSWAPHPKPLPMAVPNSAVMAAARLGMEVTVARPEGFGLDSAVMDAARAAAAGSGGSVSESSDQRAAFEGADVIYAKSWGGAARYDDPATEEAARTALMDGPSSWRITRALMQSTREARFMHCLPVRRGVVVDADVLAHPSAIHLDQAEYRLHAQKAILEWIWS